MWDVSGVSMCVYAHRCMQIITSAVTKPVAPHEMTVLDIKCEDRRAVQVAEHTSLLPNLR